MPESKDIREEILKQEADKFNADFSVEIEGVMGNYIRVDVVKNSMDEYFERKSMQLLEYMAKNRIECHEDKSGNIVFFQRNGEGLTKEQLFQNFL